MLGRELVNGRNLHRGTEVVRRNKNKIRRKLLGFLFVDKRSLKFTHFEELGEKQTKPF